MFGRFCSDQSGMTLIEVIVALVLISLIAVAFVPMISTSVKYINQARERCEHWASGRSQMEILMAKAAQGYAGNTEVLFPVKLEGSHEPPVMIQGVKIEVGTEEKLVTFLAAGDHNQ
ncbi:MAG TPA: prepilin-type N-terminal cleavage/methylation domain-containing protein [Firmicutes bacterium]|nr:prepilin-type N-terminal cleavage/methylation domain-containing protein [Bacillota bacterium]